MSWSCEPGFRFSSSSYTYLTSTDDQPILAHSVGDLLGLQDPDPSARGKDPAPGPSLKIMLAK